MLTVNTDFDVIKIRSDFPILQREVNGKPLIYFDNGATSQKPKQVIQSISEYYSSYNSNVHRGVHTLSQLATDAYEDARNKVRDFIGAANSSEIIFTRGTTESINLVAQSWGKQNLNEGDEVLVTGMEHHANIVPWQMICDERKASLRHIPLTPNGTLVDNWASYFNTKTKILAFVQVSNALGIINPYNELIQEARKHGALVLVDGAQAVPHLKVNVQQIDADFYVFSGHKMLGPTGIGILYGKQHLLENMIPYQGGGDMIKDVTFEKTTYNVSPFRFEAGTPNIEGAIALSAAIDYMQQLDWDSVESYEQDLLSYAHQKLSEIEGIKFYGIAENKVPVISFLIEGAHPYDVGFILDKNGIAVRTGQHCTQPIMDFFKIPGTIRISMAFYNTFDEIDKAVEAVKQARKMLL